MTKDDIIDMAKEADMYANSEWEHSKNPKQWKQCRDEYFADLVADAEREALRDEMWNKAMKLVSEAVKYEREACAKLVEPDDQHKGFPSDYLGGEEGVELLDCIAAKIRARGQA
jgi:hypothetical protein